MTTHARTEGRVEVFRVYTLNNQPPTYTRSWGWCQSASGWFVSERGVTSLVIGRYSARGKGCLVFGVAGEGMSVDPLGLESSGEAFDLPVLPGTVQLDEYLRRTLLCDHSCKTVRPGRVLATCSRPGYGRAFSHPYASAHPGGLVRTGSWFSSKPAVVARSSGLTPTTVASYGRSGSVTQSMGSSEAAPPPHPD